MNRCLSRETTNVPVRLYRINKLISVFRRSRLIGQIYQQENGRWYVAVNLRLSELSVLTYHEHEDEYAIRRVTYKKFTSALRKLLRTARKWEAKGRIVGEDTFRRSWP